MRPRTVDDDNIAPALYMSERPRSPAPEETNSMTIDAPDALARGAGTDLHERVGAGPGALVVRSSGQQGKA